MKKNIPTLLLVEDDDADAESTTRSLKSAGVLNPIFRVTDGDQAIAYLSGVEPFADRRKYSIPGVVLLDLKMPYVTGFEVLEWRRSQPQLKDVVFIVLSGHRDLHQVSTAYALGARTFAFKPMVQHEVESLTMNFSVFHLKESQKIKHDRARMEAVKA